MTLEHVEANLDFRVIPSSVGVSLPDSVVHNQTLRSLEELEKSTECCTP
jgi:hypothetical protein